MSEFIDSFLPYNFVFSTLLVSRRLLLTLQTVNDRMNQILYRKLHKNTCRNTIRMERLLPPNNCHFS